MANFCAPSRFRVVALLGVFAKALLRGLGVLASRFTKVGIRERDLGGMSSELILTGEELVCYLIDDSKMFR